jgi:hypothetical protein
MGNALAGLGASEQAQAVPHSAEESVLRLLLEQARELAAQSKLIAMNAALEAAAACSEAADARETDALGGSAGRTAEEMESVAASVELFLQQLQTASVLARPL